MLKIGFWLIVSGLLFLGELYSQNKREVERVEIESISAATLKEYLSVLASDEYEGRETGEKGQKMAAEYISKKFREFGLKPTINDTGYFQQYPMMVQSKRVVKLFSPQKINYLGPKQYHDSDYFAFYGLSENIINAKFIFAGYGIKDENYNDYHNLDVKDRVVMILDNEPFSGDSISPINNKKGKTQWSGTSAYRKKEEIARELGAKGVLIVTNDYKALYEKHKHKVNHTTIRLLSDEKETTTSLQQKVPVVFISENAANWLLKENKSSLKKITGKKRKKFVSRSEVVINVSVVEKKMYAENVAGLLEGTDKKDEIIVISAHYDHLGMSEGKVYNGADDDGSGTVAMMNIAKVFAAEKKAGQQFSRSILFLAFSGEEKGLLGSEYYSGSPLFPLEKTVANLNIDMIGRVDAQHKNSSNYVYIIGSDKLSNELHDINETANKMYSKLKLDYTYNRENDPNRFYYRSDHYNFAKKGVPVIFYFNGVHEDYHKETDEIHKINFELMEKRTQLVYQTAQELVNRKERIKLNPKTNDK